MMEEKEAYLRSILNNKDQISILSEKLSRIISDKDFYKYGLLEEIVDKLIECGYGETIINNFLLLIQVSIEDETMHVVNKVALLQGGKDILKTNLQAIYSKLDGEDIPEVIKLLDEEEQKRIKLRNSYAYDLYEKELIGENSLGSIIKSDMSIFVEEVIKEVSEGKNLEKLNSGTFSDVIKSNGYVIKIGQTRDKYQIPYHPNIVQPLLRENVEDEKGNNILVVEVQDEVNTKDVTDKQRKELREKLKKAKIKCADMDGDNVGILIKPNKRRLYNGVGGIIDYNHIKEETLQPGEPVIIDTDMIEIEK